jgi:thiaminase
MTYEAYRALNALSLKELSTSKDRLLRAAGYADGIFNTCTKKLGISDSTVLKTKATEALNSYMEFQINTARDNDWVLSMVALVPCLQVCLLLFCILGLLIRGGIP